MPRPAKGLLQRLPSLLVRGHRSSHLAGVV